MLAHLARTQSDMVFELNLLRRSDRQFFDKNRKIIVIERHNLHNHNLKGIVGQLLAGEASIYRSGLERNDLAFVVIDEKKRLLQRAFVQFETRLSDTSRRDSRYSRPDPLSDDPGHAPRTALSQDGPFCGGLSSPKGDIDAW